MASSRSFGRREERKAPMELPSVPDLGAKITTPRKTNRAAARTIASGDLFWDGRKVVRKARRRALELELTRTAHPGVHRLTRRQKQWLAGHLPGWSWSASGDALGAPKAATQAQLDELAAATRLPYVRRAVLKVQGLSLEQLQHVAERAPLTMRLVLVDPLTGGQRTVRVPRRG
jgi:hypothetical protein